MFNALRSLRGLVRPKGADEAVAAAAAAATATAAAAGLEAEPDTESDARVARETQPEPPAAVAADGREEVEAEMADAGASAGARNSSRDDGRRATASADGERSPQGISPEDMKAWYEKMIAEYAAQVAEERRRADAAVAG